MKEDLLEQILPHIKNHIYPLRIQLQEWKTKEGNIPDAEHPTLNDRKWETFRLPGFWGGYDKTVWFRHRMTIPPEFSGKPAALLLDLNEALAYINGKVHQGIDRNHQEILLTRKARANQTLLIAIEAYSGRKHERSTFANAELAVLNPTARTLFYSLQYLRDLERVLGSNSAEAKEAKELIRKTLIFLKYFKPEGEEYPNAIGRALKFLQTALATEFSTTVPGLVHLVGHSHLDVAWLWTLRETKRKCARTFSSMLQLMEEYPEFSFTQSQALLYQFVEEHYPDLFKQMKQRVVEGRWEAIGSMWVEPDCNIPNGESLIRQLLYGKRYFKEKFGVESQVMWLPDTFGFPSSLPQILIKSGIKYFFTTKLLWNDTNKFPHNTFWWQGIDRSRVFAHIPPVGLEGLATSKDIKKSWEAFQEKELSGDVLQTNGHGDGGGGPTKEHVEIARLFTNFPGLPQARISSAKQFFEQAQDRSHDLPVWNNELYLERHRGTYTTHAWVKKENRQCEALLAHAELLSTLAILTQKKSSFRHYPQQAIEQAWKKTLLNQFHDILPGTAIADAYDDVRQNYVDIRSSCREIIQRAIESLTDPAQKRSNEFVFTIFNPLGWQRDEYVTLSFKSNKKYFIVRDIQGQEVDSQTIERGQGTVRLLCFVRNIPPYSFVTLTVSASDTKQSQLQLWKITTRTVETPIFKIRLDTKGALSSINDKQLRREFLRKGKRGNVFHTFFDKPKQWETWELDSDFEAKQLTLFRLKAVKIVEAGPLRAVLRFEHRIPHSSAIRQDIILYHESKRIDFVTQVKWFEKQTLLKVAFPFDIKSSLPTYEIPLGAITRPSKSSNPVDRAKFEVPAQQWADLSDARSGVSLLNDCKYGYDAKETTLRLSLLRSPHYPHPIEPGKLTDIKVTDQGDHEFTYSLYPHAGDWRKGSTVRRARELNQPVVVVPNRVGKKIPPVVTASHPSIIIESVKKAEETQDVVIRAYEAHGEPRDASFEFGFSIEHIVECDLMENAIQTLKFSKFKTVLRFKPFEIKTLKVKFKEKGK